MSIEWDIEELACKVCGKSEEETDQIINDGSIDDLLVDKYEISFELYCQIIKDLLPFTVPVKTSFGNVFRGFVEDGRLIVKEKAEGCDEITKSKSCRRNSK